MPSEGAGAVPRQGKKPYPAEVTPNPGAQEDQQMGGTQTNSTTEEERSQSHMVRHGSMHEHIQPAPAPMGPKDDPREMWGLCRGLGCNMHKHGKRQQNPSAHGVSLLWAHRCSDNGEHR